MNGQVLRRAHFLTAFIIVISFLGLIIYKSFNNADYLLKKDPFDYAKTGESFWKGEGISLVGVPYVLLPPAFPVISGFINIFFDNPEVSVKFTSILFWLISILMFFFFLKIFFTDIRYLLMGIILYAGHPSLLDSAAAGRVEPVFLSVLLLLLIILHKSYMTDRTLRKPLLSILMLAAVSSFAYYLRPEGLWIAGMVWSILIIKLNASLLRKLIYSIAFAGVLFILILPYLFFLKTHTGRWQLSGKTYANLVMGERESPYQLGRYPPGALPDRYTIIGRIIANPMEARTATEYLKESGGSLLNRISINLESLAFSLLNSYSVIGIILIILGITSMSIDRQIWFWGVLSVFGVYLLFFILNRIVAVYHPVFVVFALCGIIRCSELLNKTQYSRLTGHAQYIFMLALLMFQLRTLFV